MNIDSKDHFEILQNKAKYIRRRIFDVLVKTQKGHIGGAFSCVDILVAMYYSGLFNFCGEDRDRFIMSKGHACLALFSILADLDFFDDSILDEYCNNGNILGGHPDIKVPGIEATSGSLGHGLGIEAGFALADSLDIIKRFNIVLMGDGECHEGSVWEAAMFASQRKLNNLIAIIDCNEQCATDYIDNVITLRPIIEKWIVFGWDAITVDGHDMASLINVFKVISKDTYVDRPVAIIASTVKGKGVSYMEGQVKWHHGLPNESEIEQAKKELA